MLPSPDVIFYHPIKKFSVLYHNNKLWQLPRRDFNGTSLRYMQPFTGNLSEIVVAFSQQLDPDDLVLQSQLLTLDLPKTLVGRNANEFMQWWQANRHAYRRELQEKSARQAEYKRLLQQKMPQRHSPINASQSYVTPNADALTSQKPSHTTANDAPVTTSQSDTIFDDLLADLTKNL